MTANTKQRSARAQRRNELRRLNQQQYLQKFYRTRYRGSLMGAAFMVTLMAGLSFFSKSMIPLLLTLPIVAVSLALQAWLWRRRLGWVVDE